MSNLASISIFRLLIISILVFPSQQCCLEMRTKAYNGHNWGIFIMLATFIFLGTVTQSNKSQSEEDIFTNTKFSKGGYKKPI